MSKENKNKIIALSVTVVVHIIVVVLMVKMALRTPLPLPGEAGVEVKFGYEEQGMSQEQAQEKPEKTVQKPKPQPKPTNPEPKKVDNQTVTQNTEETPDIVEEKPQKEKPVSDPRKLYHNNEQQEQNVSEGKTDKEGDLGKENGDIESENTEGPGGGGVNTEHDLGGRDPLGSLPKPDRELLTQKGDRICIQIKVDSNGNVVDAIYKQKGSTMPNTSENQEAINAAIAAAKQSRWKMKKDDTGIITGSITYFIK